jgi:hypothetical protein
MAPSIPTRRPLVTATRLSVSITVAACASTLYLAFGSAWAVTGLPTQDNTAATICPVASSDPAPVSAAAGAREERASIQ